MIRMSIGAIASIFLVSCSSGSSDTAPQTATPTTAAATTVPATDAPTTTVEATTTTVVTAADIATCIQFFDAIGGFASSGSRQWVNPSGTNINVSPLDWWKHQGDLNDAITALLTQPDNPDLAALLVDASNLLQDDLAAEVDDSDQNAFPLAVLEAVRSLDRISRSFEDRCHALGSEVDAFHPLDQGGHGGAEDS